MQPGPRRNASIAWPLRPRRPGRPPPPRGRGRRRSGAGPIGPSADPSASRRVIASSRAINSSGGMRQARSASARLTRANSPPCFLAALPPGVLDEDAAHRLGGGGEEVAAPIPAPVAAVADEAQIRLVDQRGGLEGLPRGFAGQASGGQPAELLVDQRQQSRGLLRIALLRCRPRSVRFVHRKGLPDDPFGRKVVSTRGTMAPILAGATSRRERTDASRITPRPAACQRGSIQPDSRPGQGRRPCALRCDRPKEPRISLLRCRRTEVLCPGRQPMIPRRFSMSVGSSPADACCETHHQLVLAGVGGMVGGWAVCELSGHEVAVAASCDESFASPRTNSIGPFDPRRVKSL